MQPQTAAKPRVVLCDDHPLMQEGLKILLSPGFDVVGVASDGESAISLASTLHPAVVILDIALPLLSGLEVCRQMRGVSEVKPKVVFFTMCDGLAYVRESFRLGASAYVSKSSPASELIKGIWAVLSGRQFVSLPGFKGDTFLFDADGKNLLPFSELTTRQREVLQLVGEGYSAKMIAAQLKVAQKTVEFHKTSIMEALNLRSTAEIVRFAVESGLVGPLADSRTCRASSASE